MFNATEITSKNALAVLTQNETIDGDGSSLCSDNPVFNIENTLIIQWEDLDDGH